MSRLFFFLLREVAPVSVPDVVSFGFVVDPEFVEPDELPRLRFAVPDCDRLWPD